MEVKDHYQYYIQCEDGECNITFNEFYYWWCHMYAVQQESEVEKEQKGRLWSAHTQGECKKSNSQK